MTAELHLAENALALHLFLERLESLIDVVVANENLHAESFVLLDFMINRDSGDEHAPTAAMHMTSGAGMYQIKPGMSTGAIRFWWAIRNPDFACQSFV